MRRVLISFVAVCGPFAALPAAASAWTASVSSGTLTAVADTGTFHDVFTIFDLGSNLRVVNTLSGASAGSGCSFISTTTVDCAESGITRLEAFGKDGNDSITLSGSFNTITSSFNTLNGAAGDDVLAGTSSGSSTMADDIKGGAGNDSLSGGSGNDTLDGGLGTDIMGGGTGFEDTVEYGSHDFFGNGRFEDLSVSIGDGPNDGSLRDGPVDARDDVLADVENLIGGSGDDLLIGDPDSNEIRGVGGDDHIRGGIGTDLLNGGDGEDLLRGEDDSDTLEGESGDDVLKGGEINDILEGGFGADLLNGGPNFLAGDTATYVFRTESLTVTIGAGSGDDGGPSDGISGERDTVRGTIENITGGDGNDVLTGSEVANTFMGGDGADVLTGLAGIDTMSYDDHLAAVAVVIDGTPNDGSAADGPSGARDLVKTDIENLIGSDFADSLKGSGLANVIEGGLGADSLFGVNGDDDLLAEDGIADAVLNCGGGTGDFVDLDSGLDPAPIGCEAAF